MPFEVLKLRILGQFYNFSKVKVIQVILNNGSIFKLDDEMRIVNSKLILKNE